jgi:hypothetical protein
MVIHGWEVTASFLSFLGGAFLAGDALFAQRHALEKEGKEILLKLVKAANGTYADGQNREISSERDVEYFFIRRSLVWSRLGFVLMTIGFAIDVITKTCAFARAPLQ